MAGCQHSSLSTIDDYDAGRDHIRLYSQGNHRNTGEPG